MQFPQNDLSFRNETRDYLCPGLGVVTDASTKYYNDMGTLMFNSHETVIRQLFHHNGRHLEYILHVYPNDVLT